MFIYYLNSILNFLYTSSRKRERARERARLRIAEKDVNNFFLFYPVLNQDFLDSCDYQD